MEKHSIFDSIRKWAREKGIYEKGDPKTQTLKLVEEVGELSKALLEKNDSEVFDAIGDCAVVLTNICELYEQDVYKRNPNNPMYRRGIEGCLKDVYDVISKRKGEMKNGTFVKE